MCGDVPIEAKRIEVSLVYSYLWIWERLLEVKPHAERRTEG